MSASVLHRFADRGGATENRHGQKYRAGYFQPQLVGRAPERSGCGAGPAHHRIDGAAASGLLPGYPRDHSQLSNGRNLIHGLDFNSLRGYNDATYSATNRSRAAGI